MTPILVLGLELVCIGGGVSVKIMVVISYTASVCACSVSRSVMKISMSSVSRVGRLSAGTGIVVGVGFLLMTIVLLLRGLVLSACLLMLMVRIELIVS